MTQPLTNSRPKMALDEASFQNLLAAASIMQQHADRLIAKDPAASSTEALSEVAQAQKLIQGGKLDFAAAASLIAERLLKSTKAGGVAIGLVEDDRLVYAAALGDAASQRGTRVPLDYGLAGECLLNGEVQRCEDAEFDARVPFSLRRKGNIQSFLAVPIRREDAVVGAVELRFAEPRGFHEQDVRTCELMAGLLSEAFSRPEKRSSRLEKFTGELAPFLTDDIFQSILESPLDKDEGDKQTGKAELNEDEDTNLMEQVSSSFSIAPMTVPQESLFQERQDLPGEKTDSSLDPAPLVPASPVGLRCRSCGHEFTGEEAFCGNCGITRVPRESEEGYLQHKWATLWYMKEAVRRKESVKEQLAEEKSPLSSASTSGSELESTKPSASTHAGFDSSAGSEELFQGLTQSGSINSKESQQTTEEFSFSDPFLIEPIPAEIEEADSTDDEIWASTHDEGPLPDENLLTIENQQTRTGESTEAALKAWLVQLQAYRAEIYLGVAAILLVIALVGWGAPKTAVANSSKANIPAAPQLTAFEKLLVATGLADAPEAPHIYPGNPDTEVWLDVHTALYYCPGSGLYGKTPGGRVTTQKSAQQDQFEPAARRACD